MMTDTLSPTTRSRADFAAAFRAGFIACLPISASVAVFGLVYGFLAQQKGLSALEATLMSLLVFAGASQMLALELWTSPPAIAGLALAVFIINLRYVMQTAALYPLLRPHGLPVTLAAIFFNADENWAVTIGAMRDGETRIGFYWGTAFNLYVFWALATIAGAVIGRAAGSMEISPQALGLHIVGAAVFTALLVGLARQGGGQDSRLARCLLPWATAGITAAIAAQILPGTWFILIGGLSGSLVGAVYDTRR